MISRPSSQQDFGTVPMVVWDGLGLSAALSGVGVNGSLLYQALKELGCQPHVAAFADEALSFVAADHVLKIPVSENKLLNRFLKLKPFYPVSTYRAQKYLWPDVPVIFHGLSNVNLPIVSSKKPGDRFVITIHDIIPLNLNRFSPLALQMSALLPRVIERADRIITGSYWTKIQLMERYGMDLGNKIQNIAYGTLPASYDAPRTTEKTIDGLTIARGEDYKRLELIAALATRCSTMKFVVVTDSEGRKRLEHAPANVSVLSRLSKTEMEALYAKAKVLIHPSLYEGWCLPAADALIRGLYLLYCQGSGIDEVASYGRQQAQGLTRGASLDDWVSALESIAAKPKPNPTELKLPTWLDIGQKTLKIYQSLV